MFIQSMRWFGPSDPVPLQHIKQAGASAVFSSLHHIPYGEVWSEDEVVSYRSQIESAGLQWTAVESLPVHEEIKSRSGNFKKYIENYKSSIRNLGKSGPSVVIYNFMPVLDWVRTDMNYFLADGSRSLSYDPVKFAAFDLFILKRKNAEVDHSVETTNKAEKYFKSLSTSEVETFTQSIIDIFPGVKLGLSLQDIRNRISTFDGFSADNLRENLFLFLKEILPVAEESGISLAVHPDDPPFPILGLPRICSTHTDFRSIIDSNDSSSNGICFCTGSLGPLTDNDLPKMALDLAPKIFATHLRNIKRNDDGSFYEAPHLDGDLDLIHIIENLIEATPKNPKRQLPIRPDHGLVMMNDLDNSVITPGYSGIGRMRGLAEIRGVINTLQRKIPSQS